MNIPFEVPKVFDDEKEASFRVSDGDGDGDDDEVGADSSGEGEQQEEELCQQI